MDATPISFDTAVPLGAGAAGEAAEFADPTSRNWAALHDAAAVVAELAGVASASSGAFGTFPAAIRGAPHWRRQLAEQGVQDLTAMMEPGLAALISVHAAGRDPAVPALALWQEFAAAREALLATVLPAG